MGSNAARRSGPWDAADLTADERGLGRIDLGGLLVGAMTGTALRLEAAEGVHIAVTFVLDGLSAQLQAFVAVPGEPLWNAVRGELAEILTGQGADVREQDGPFGTELVAVRADDGDDETWTGTKVLRFVGADGPGWFLRGVTVAEPSRLDAASDVLDHVFREAVVVNEGAGTTARDPIVLRPPH